jgi:hypothetical protein
MKLDAGIFDYIRAVELRVMAIEARLEAMMTESQQTCLQKNAALRAPNGWPPSLRDRHEALVRQ